MQILVLVRFVLVLASEHEFDNYINVNAGSSFWYFSGEILKHTLCLKLENADEVIAANYNYIARKANKRYFKSILSYENLNLLISYIKVKGL